MCDENGKTAAAVDKGTALQPKTSDNATGQPLYPRQPQAFSIGSGGLCTPCLEQRWELNTLVTQQRSPMDGHVFFVCLFDTFQGTQGKKLNPSLVIVC